ncbi:MAG: cobamide remodeling phosphodiesterase CbiR [Puniceicoccales bacterium]
MNGNLPYRIGTTSFILADDYEPNLRFLADKTEDIALLFFESIHDTTPPRWIETARKLQQERDLTFSVHLPTDIRLGSSDEAVRSQAIESCVRIIQMLSPLAPSAFVCHADGDPDLPFAKSNQAALASSLRTLGKTCGDPRKICLENVRMSHDELRAALNETEASICYDIGHALLRDQPILDELSRWLPRCRVIHLHGVSGDRDHHPLDCLPPPLLDQILCLYASERGQPGRILTLELFNRTRWESSLITLREALNRPSAEISSYLLS